MAQPKDAGERLFMLAEGLANSLVDISDAELLEDARLAGRDPEVTEARVKGLLTETVIAFKRERLAKAESEHSSVIAAMQNRSKFKMPTDPATRRLLLGRLTHQQPQVANTLQFRELDELTDEDVESMLGKLALLGVLDEE